MDLYSIVRTSRDTAEAEAVVLRQTETTRIVFKPVLVNNARDAQAPVRGAFCFQRKGPKDDWEEHNEVALSRLKAGEWIKLELGAGEIHQLLSHLGALYREYRQEGLPRGRTRFVKITTDPAEPDGSDQVDLRQLFNAIDQAGVDVATRVLEWMADTSNAPELLDQLERLEIESLQQINSVVGVANLKAVYQLWEDNQANGDEEFWQQTFQQHAFALTQVFAFPVVLFRGKAYVGGKGLANTGGNIVDFLATNHLTRNAVLIEIKTPNTKLLGGKYRDGGIYGASDELSGAVAQVLSYRHSLNREFDRIGRDYREQLEAFSPQCLVVAGHAARDLAPERLQSFELFRDAVAGTVTVITYDELFGKVRALIEVLEGNNGTTAK